jgi:hypothetical protein
MGAKEAPMASKNDGLGMGPEKMTDVIALIDAATTVSAVREAGC